MDNTVTSGGSNNFKYVYQYKDHLGNVRMDFTVSSGLGGTGIATIKEENHYYAFGLKHMNYNMDYLEYQEQGGDVVLAPPPVKLKNNYKFLGQERQDDLGLNWDT